MWTIAGVRIDPDSSQVNFRHSCMRWIVGPTAACHALLESGPGMACLGCELLKAIQPQGSFASQLLYACQALRRRFRMTCLTPSGGAPSHALRPCTQDESQAGRQTETIQYRGTSALEVQRALVSKKGRLRGSMCVRSACIRLFGSCRSTSDAALATQHNQLMV